MKLRNLIGVFAVAAGVATASAAPAMASPGQATIPGASETAQTRPATFPHLFSHVKGAPTYDSSGKPSPWNDVVWDHATVLTRSQTAMVRNAQGIRVVVGAAQIAPYSELARSATLVIASDGALLNKGGCLSLYWSDKPFTAPGGKTVQTAAQVLAPQNCTD